MKKYFLLLVFTKSLFANSQNVGIGTGNPQNKLHVAGGFRLDTLTGVNGAGLLRHDANGVVYGIKFSGNTSDVLRGDGSFGAVNVNGAVGWLLNGNSGTNPATHFIGTTDDQPLLFRVNNLRHGYLHKSIFFGNGAGLMNISNPNIAIGNGALGKNTLSYGMVAIGDSALYNTDRDVSILSENTAIGYRSLYANVTGYQNTAVGSQSLISNTSGYQNVGIGAYALRANTTGAANVAVGYALLLNTTGSSNTAVGNQAMFENTTGQNNTAFGYNALIYNKTGSDNTAIGYHSGSGGGHPYGTGHRNTSVGYFALTSNRVSENTAVGYRAMFGNTTGFGNNALGAYALENNSTGLFNSAFGFEALRRTTNNWNSAFGAGALASTTSGYGNTAVGSGALGFNLTGFWNTAAGFASGNGLPNNVGNVIVIGYNTGWNTTLSNQVNIGNFSASWIGGQVGWSTYSDKRIKNDIKEDVPGLSFITKLKPITYHLDIRKQEEIANTGKYETSAELIKPVQKDWEGKYDVEKIKMSGFFAQDVEQAAKAVNYSFSGVHNPRNGGLYSLNYSAFVVPLVKAVQEQQSIIEKQQKLIDQLLKRVEALEKK